MLKVLTDGPTRVLKLTNIKNKSYLSINWDRRDSHESTTSVSSLPSSSSASHSTIVNPQTPAQQKSLELYVNLSGGIGVSLIQWFNQEYEELVYSYFKSLEVNFDRNSLEQKLLLGIQSIQICNQLINASRQNLLLVHTNSAGSAQSSSSLSSATSNETHNELAVKIDFLQKFRLNNSQVYIEHLILSLSDLNLQIEEQLLWKLIQFFGLNKLESRSHVNAHF